MYCCSRYLSIFEMRNGNFVFHGRTREPLPQPETTSTHRTLAVTHGKPWFLGLCCRLLCGVYVVLEKCAGFLSTSEQSSLHGWNSNSQILPYFFNRQIIEIETNCSLQEWREPIDYEG